MGRAAQGRPRASTRCWCWRASRPACPGSRSCESATTSDGRSTTSIRRRSRAYGPEKIASAARRSRHRAQPRQDRGRDPVRPRLARADAGAGRLSRLPLAVRGRQRRSSTTRARWPTSRPRAPRPARMSKALKARGFKFVGPTICYAFMQATGMVDDHVVDCFRRTGRDRAALSAAQPLELVDGPRPVACLSRRDSARSASSGRRSGSAGSSWSRCRRRGCAAPACRRPGRASGTCRAPPSRAGTPSPSRESSSPSSARSRSIHSASVARVASYRRSISSARQLRGQRERRQPRAVQDLVRVGVADAAEQARVGQRALEGVVLARERCAERCEVASRAPRGRRDRAPRAPLRPRPRGAMRASSGRPRSASACRPESRRRPARGGRRASRPARASAAGRRSSGGAPARGRPPSRPSTIRLPSRRSSRTALARGRADRRQRGAQQRTGSRAARLRAAGPGCAPPAPRCRP